MAVQFHVAHSAKVIGAGIIAGGPYYCAQGNVLTAAYNCMQPGWWTPLPRTALLKEETDARAADQRIDPVAHLAAGRAWLFTGKQDRTVYPQVVNALADFYATYKTRVVVVSDKPAGHGMVTELRGKACSSSEPPYILDCDYDAAGAMLRFLLDNTKPAPAKESGRVIRFDQNAYAEGDARAISMDDAGFAYVPQRCEKERCRIHVAFHGCRQGADEIGEQFVQESGYNVWADANGLIVLYPQAIKRYSPFLWNPRGCWDWWGYTGPDYHTQSGAQIRAVKAMIDRLAE
jgi:hypothetical protein